MPRRLLIACAAALTLGLATPALPAAAPDPTATAYAALRPSAPDVRFERVRRSPIGVHVRGRQYRGGVPVAGSAALVTIARGRVIQAVTEGFSALPGRPASHPLPPVTPASLVAPHVERLMVARAGDLVDTWRVSVLSTGGPATYDVDVATGVVRGRFDDARYVDGNATVFDPNPIVRLRNNGLRQPLVPGGPVEPDLDSAELTSALVNLPLRSLDDAALSSGRLVGPYASVIGPTMPLTNGQFSFTRGSPQFESTMAYAHLDRYQRYVRALGFSNVNAESQDTVTLRLEGFDQSLYYPGLDVVVFGTGGVDDGEDAEIILHEYGHAMQDDQVSGFGGSGGEAGAMGEGFGDFQAAAYYARTSSKGFGDVCVGEWDATSYASGNPPCLRRMDSAKRYPQDIVGAVHDDGEIWSAFLWRLRARLGGSAAEQSDNALRLVIASHELLTPNASFGAAVGALRVAAAELRHPEWGAVIDAAAKSHGLPLNG